VKRLRAVLAAILLAAASSLLGPGCHEAPITERNQLILLPESQELALGATAYQETLAKEKLSTDPVKVAMVKRVGARIAAVASKDAPDYEWEFNLIDDDKTVNAFCLPGGKVAVYTGILPYTQDEEGLAVVMGHEVAHATARHGGERISTGLLAQVGLAAMNVALAVKGQSPETIQAFNTAYGVGANVGVILPFSRKQESEADHIGLMYMARAGYNPRAAPAFWSRMAKAQKERPPEFLATHPSDEKRVKALEKLMEEAEAEYRRSRAVSSRR
jgi:predicted Zn-dependent protease